MISVIKITGMMILAVFLLSNSSVNDKETYYRFIKIEGNVKYWIPLSGKWRPLSENLELPVGTIIQLGENDRIDFFRFTKLPKGWSGKQLYIKTKDPVNLRLDANLLRELNVDEMHMRRLIEKDKEIEKRKKKLSAKQLMEDAWDRVSVFFNVDKQQEIDDFLSELKNNMKDDVEVGTTHDRITVFQPQDGQLIISESFPVSIKVSWEGTKGRQYDLYLWKANEFKQSPIARAYSDFYALSLPAEGSYNLQIVSADKTRASRPILLHVDKFKFQKVDRLVKTYSIDSFKLVFPHNDFMYLTQNKQHLVEFYWNYPKDFNEVAIFNVQGIDNKIKVEEKIEQSIRTKKSLPVGSYHWWVKYDMKVLDPKTNKEKIVHVETDRYLLRVAHKETNNDIYSLLQKTGLPLNLYLDQGL